MNDQPSKSTEAVEDLDIAAGEAAEVKGGSLNFTKVEFKNIPTGDDAVKRYHLENAWPAK